MARLPRLDLPGIAQRIVQRGNNRLPCFLDDGDRRRYLHLLADSALKSGCRIHAYVLMDNHAHLLATPDETGGVGRMMQRLGRGYVPVFNARHGRTGTLWEGRYKSCLVDTERYALACYRYIELNPVRARIVDAPACFAWSSHGFNAYARPDRMLSPHASYLTLGRDAEERARAYRELVRELLPEQAVQEIRAYLQQQRALGRDEFRKMVEAKTKRFAGIRAAHRPRRQASGD